MWRHISYISGGRPCIYMQKARHNLRSAEAWLPTVPDRCVFDPGRLGRDAGQTDWTETAAPAPSVKSAVPGSISCIGQAEAEVVVAIRRRVVVAIRHARVLRVVVPRPAAVYPVRAFVGMPYFMVIGRSVMTGQQRLVFYFSGQQRYQRIVADGIEIFFHIGFKKIAVFPQEKLRL